MRRTCSVEDCERPRASAQGWCSMHWKRWKRLGRVHLLTDLERFFQYVDKNGPGGCWLWTGAKTRGYGHFSVGPRRGGWQGNAYRWLYEQIHGAIPPGLQLDHLCRTPACVNPDHLEPVTCQTNLLRGDTFQAANIAKTHCIHGHAFTPENTYHRPDQPEHRDCRACRRDAGRRSRAAAAR